MSGFEWFLLVVVVILVPLVVAVAITLWTLEQARQRNRKNREGANPVAGPVKRKATRNTGSDATVVASTGGSDSARDKAGEVSRTGSPDEVMPKVPATETATSGKDAAGDGASGDAGGSSDGSAGSGDGGGGGGDG